jgi:glutamyl-tRNA reductase
LWIANRSPERARDLAAETGGQPAAWDRAPELLAKADIVVTSVSGSDWRLSREAVTAAMHARGNRRIFLIDLGVPRNIDPAVADFYNVFLYSVDDLREMVEQNRHAREEEVPGAETIIAEHVEKFAAWQSGSEAGATLAALRDKLRLERELFAGNQREVLERFPAAERARVLELMDGLLEHLLREPSARLLKNPEVRERAIFLRELFGLDGSDAPGGGRRPGPRSGRNE